MKVPINSSHTDMFQGKECEFSMVVEMVPLKGGRWHITPQKARTLSGI